METGINQNSKIMDAITLWVILRWFIVTISFTAVVFMFWYFACALCKSKLKRCLLVAVLIGLSITAYYMTHKRPTVVRMQEDVLYIRPNNE